MEKGDRDREMDRFFSVGDVLSLQAGQSKRFVALTDFDGFPPVIAHRTAKGRVYCPATKDAMVRSELVQKCVLCDRGVPRMTMAAISIWNFTDKVRQIALFSGPKKGTLFSLKKIFNTLNTHRVVVDISREGSGREGTTYAMVPVNDSPDVPEGIVPFTNEEIIKLAEALLQEREEGW